ncbi:MAG: CDP-alcohol phosphatidyltransferase family protein [Gammaproteobacteria bacterium]|nr:CDP-alcohol phosphatidyltransferase family protein [Gammaproteobacteria bacterium]
MTTVYELKSHFQALLRPLVNVLAGRGVTANQVTVAALLLSIVGGGVVLWQPYQAWPLLLLPVVLLLRMGLNAMDGMLAREHDQQSRLGVFLNELGDVISDAVLYLPLGVVPRVYTPLIVGLVVLAITCEMAGVLAVQVGAQRQYQGPMGKSDRALWLGTLALMLGLGVLPENYVNGVLGLICLLLIRTTFNRVRGALRNVDTIVN